MLNGKENHKKQVDELIKIRHTPHEIKPYGIYATKFVCYFQRVLDRIVGFLLVFFCLVHSLIFK